MNALLSRLGTRLAQLLAKPLPGHSTSIATRPDRLLASLRLGDVLLVEGNTRVSTAIKYLTQSTWSHAALYVGSRLAAAGGSVQHCFVEADMVDGVRTVGVEAFQGLHTRICMPLSLTDEERQRVADFAVARIGNRNDMRHVIDLVRYLLPTRTVPTRYRRGLL